jgi:hypothetical protein
MILFALLGAGALAAGPECGYLAPDSSGNCAYYRKITGGTPTAPKFSVRWTYYRTYPNSATGDLGLANTTIVQNGMQAWSLPHNRLSGWFSVAYASVYKTGSFYQSAVLANRYNDISVKSGTWFATWAATTMPEATPSDIAAVTNRDVNSTATGTPAFWEVSEADIWINDGYTYGFTSEYPTTIASATNGSQFEAPRSWTIAHEVGHIIGLADLATIPGLDVDTSIMIRNEGSPGDDVYPGNHSFNDRVVGATDFRRSLEIANYTRSGSSDQALFRFARHPHRELDDNQNGNFVVWNSDSYQVIYDQFEYPSLVDVDPWLEYWEDTQFCPGECEQGRPGLLPGGGSGYEWRPPREVILSLAAPTSGVTRQIIVGFYLVPIPAIPADCRDGVLISYKEVTLQTGTTALVYPGSEEPDDGNLENDFCIPENIAPGDYYLCAATEDSQDPFPNNNIIMGSEIFTVIDPEASNLTPDVWCRCNDCG